MAAAHVEDFTRARLSLMADTFLSGHRVARELDGLIMQRGCPAVVVSDYGTERTSTGVSENSMSYFCFHESRHNRAEG